MKIKYMKQAVEMLNKEWNLGKKESGATGNICAWIYLMEILEESEKIILYKENDKLLGFCGYSKYNSKKNFVKKKFYGIIKKMLCLSPKIKDKNAFKLYNDNYKYTPKELEKYFDGEISILIVDKECRGKKIGYKLLRNIMKYAKEDNMKNIQILTDESCSYKFYEKFGCEKVYETIVENMEYEKIGTLSKEKAFIYEYKL